MKSLVLLRCAAEDKDLVGFEDGTVGLLSGIQRSINDRPLAWDKLLLPPQELNGENEVHLIKKIGPFQSGEVKLSLQRVQVDGYELIVGWDPGEELWAYVDHSFQPVGNKQDIAYSTLQAVV